MRAHVYARRTSGGGVSEHMKAISAGLKRHGVSVDVRPPGNPAPCDLAVVWGVRKAREMESGRRALVLERGYVGDRMGMWTSVGFDGLNGRADFRNAGMDSARWDRLFAPYMSEGFEEGSGDYVLVMGQVDGDAALRGMSVERWARSVVAEIRRHGLPVRFRPHPKGRPVNAGCEVAGGSLSEALGRAMWAVTYNSNSGVDAILQGVPAVSMDPGSMVWSVTGRTSYQAPPQPDRSVWASEIAWTQWSLEEIRRGDAWDHLRGGLPV